MMFVEVKDPATRRMVMINIDAIVVVAEDEKAQARIVPITGIAIDTGLPFEEVRQAIEAAETELEPDDAQ